MILATSPTAAEWIGIILGVTLALIGIPLSLSMWRDRGRDEDSHSKR